MSFTILDWNIGGAKVLEQKTRKERDETRGKINEALNKLLTKLESQPDVVALQEIVRWREPGDDKYSEVLDVKDDVLKEVPDYSYFPFELINSDILSAKAKWNKVKKDSDWHPDTYFAQGNAFLIKNDAPHFPVWDLSDLKQKKPTSRAHFIELVHLDSGLYFGDRNTEPRAALVAHFICDPASVSGQTEEVSNKPLDVFVVNLHLTTLMMEREGVPEIDTRAEKIRRAQLDVVFNGIVSRYNSWRRNGYRERGERKEEDANFTIIDDSIVKLESEGVPDCVLKNLTTLKNTQNRGKENFLYCLKSKLGKDLFDEHNLLILKHAKKKPFETIDRHSPVWIIAGDFNFTESSPEYGYVMDLNFIDTIPDAGRTTKWGHGTKASGEEKDPTLTLDYIFAGPKFVSLDHAIDVSLYGNRAIHDPKFRASDHYPLFSSMNLIPL